MRTTGLATTLCLATLWAAPAMAQYRNSSFGFDAGYWLIQKPSVTDSKGNIIADPTGRPLRLQNGGRFGGETNFKMSSDHWWFTGRVNIGILQYPDPPASNKSATARFDREASAALGTLLGVQGSMGVRYFIFTDRVRPYLQFGLSYLRLISFKDAASSDCTDGVACVDGGSNTSNYMPHPNVGGLHVQPGVEWVFTRDIAINLFADVEHWIIFNAPDNNAVVIGIGILFFT
jgi:hypothetical protein